MNKVSIPRMSLVFCKKQFVSTRRITFPTLHAMRNKSKVEWFDRLFCFTAAGGAITGVILVIDERQSALNNLFVHGPFGFILGGMFGGLFCLTLPITSVAGLVLLIKKGIHKMKQEK